MSETVVTEDDFQKALEDAHVRGLQILQAALGTGPLMFAAVIAFLYLQRKPVQVTDAALQQMQLFSMVHGFMFMSLFAVSGMVHKSTLERSRGASASDCVMAIRSATIVRMALLEGGALFGLVVVFLSMQNGALDAQPLFALNGLSAVVFVLIVATTLPTRERLVELWRTHMSPT